LPEGKNIVCAFDSGWQSRNFDGRAIADYLTQFANVTVIGYDRGIKYPASINSLIGKTESFSDLWHIIDQADLFVGVDSLPLHIANYQNVPNIGIFNVTEPDHVVSEWSDFARQINVNGLECSPCYKEVCDKLTWHKYACWNQITVEKLGNVMGEIKWN
jgi:ADP-heptose:LPS heptosyltransferase